MSTPSVAPVTSPEMLSATYNRNLAVLRNNLEDLSHEESMVQPSPRGNCLNWVVGHILATRNDIFALLDRPDVWDAHTARRYRQGSEPITRPDEAQPLSDMMAILDESQDKLTTALSCLTSAGLTRQAGDRTLAEALESLAWHEAYHVGQTVLLRRLAGR